MLCHLQYSSCNNFSLNLPKSFLIITPTYRSERDRYKMLFFSHMCSVSRQHNRDVQLGRQKRSLPICISASRFNCTSRKYAIKFRFTYSPHYALTHRHKRARARISFSIIILPCTSSCALTT